METKFQKISNALPSIFGVGAVSFVQLDNESYAVRSSTISMFCSCELRKLIEHCDKIGLSFYVRSSIFNDCDVCEFVVY